ncbi:MAG: TPM domain-containing protein, partial [Spirulinaceae cyanobacterium]
MNKLPTRVNLKKKWLSRLLLAISSLLLLTGLWATPAQAQIYDLPQVRAGEPTWVIDTANLLSRSNRGKLNNVLEDLADKTGNEFRFVTVRRLDYGETIESFTDKLFQSWFPASEDQANQSLLALDSVTNNVALRSGDAAQKLLTEDIASSIVAETVGIPLREGNKYNQAFLDASDRVFAVLSGQQDPGPPQVKEQINIESTYATAEETDDRSATVWVIGM